MNVSEIMGEVELAGAEIRLSGDRVRVWYPEPEKREELAGHIALLRSHRDEVAECLRSRRAPPAMPSCVRLLAWNLRKPPVAVETCAVVVDPALFARTTLEQLRVALAEPRRWVGWSVPQLMDRLGQVGVVVALEDESEAQ
jgi:hypothetical protein